MLLKLRVSIYKPSKGILDYYSLKQNDLLFEVNNIKENKKYLKKYKDKRSDIINTVELV